MSIFPDLLFYWPHTIARMDLAFARSVVSLFAGLTLYCCSGLRTILIAFERERQRAVYVLQILVLSLQRNGSSRWLIDGFKLCL